MNAPTYPPCDLPARLPATPGLLAGRLALVTGAAGGIGRAIATAFAQAGARVVVTDIDAARCRETLAEVRASGVDGWAYGLDVTHATACATLAATVAAEAGHVDTLVNNAGVLIREGIDSPRAHENMRRTMDVNLFGTFHTVHAFLPALRATRGCIINIASGAAFIAQGGCLGYSPSKGAVKMFTQTLALDLAPDGIRVNALAPGVIETPMTGATRADPARMAHFLSLMPAGRLGQPREIAGPALFLASSLASFVTGVILPVDGGRLAV